MHIFYISFCTFSDMVDTCFRKHVLSVFTHCSQHVQIYQGFWHISDMFDTYDTTHVISVSTHTRVPENICFYGLRIIDTMSYFYMGSSHFLTCLTHVSENMWFYWHMFQKACAFTWVLCTLLTTCVMLHWSSHVLPWFPHFRKHVILHGRCAHDWQHV